MGQETLLRIGIPWDADGFVAQSKKVTHPFDRGAMVADTTKEAIFNVLVSGPEGAAEHRRVQWGYWKRRAEELDPEGRRLFEGAPEE
eukprot:3497134-Lingulodinium_polyedra.AAC.1